MKVKVHFHYVESEIPPRCRRARDVEHTGELEVEIRETTEEKAPIAFRETKPQWNQESKCSEIKQYDYRWYADRLWIDFSPWPHRPPLSPIKSERSDSKVYFYDRQKSGFEKACTAIENWASIHLIIGDKLHTLADEPVYEVSFYNAGTQASIRAIRVKQFSWNYFRIDELGLAKENVKRRLGTNNSDEPSVVETFEIFIPEAVRAKPSEGALEDDRKTLARRFQFFLDHQGFLFNGDQDFMHQETMRCVETWMAQQGQPRCIEYPDYKELLK